MTEHQEWPEIHKLTAEEVFNQIENGWPMLKDHPLPQYDNSIPEFRKITPKEKE